MLSHCLIFLCIGAYASCMPTFLPIFSETLKLLNELMKEGNSVKPKNESMQSVEIPITLEKECGSYNLNKFIQSLHLLKTEDSEILANAYAGVHNALNTIAKSKAITEILKPENENNCETSNISTNKFLEELAAFLTELYHLLKSHKGTK